VTPRGLRTADGTERELDAIVFATGYQVHDRQGLEGVHGREGRSISEVWKEGGTRAHRGTTIAGFPNHFTLLGPNTGGGHQSIVYMIESQITYVLSALELMEERNLDAIEVRPEAMEAYNRAVQERSKRTVWLTGGCESWYLDDEGRNTTIWPSFTFQFRRMTREIDPAEYLLRASSRAAGEDCGDHPDKGDDDAAAESEHHGAERGELLSHLRP
jgi:hypothetical protein